MFKKIKEKFSAFKSQPASMDNLYTLSGKVSILKAIPYGLQHVLAMFVANITPVIIIAGACGLSQTDTARLIQTAMIIAGLGTLVQLFPIWRVGSKLPVVFMVRQYLTPVFSFIILATVSLLFSPPQG